MGVSVLLFFRNIPTTFLKLNYSSKRNISFQIQFLLERNNRITKIISMHIPTPRITFSATSGEMGFEVGITVVCVVVTGISDSEVDVLVVVLVVEVVRGVS